MIAILSSLYNLVDIEVFLIVMNSLLGSIVPASVNPHLTLTVLPSPVYLCYNRLRHIVSILQMDPISDLPQFVVMHYTVRQR